MIALVITIIVLLILAGVTIQTLTGDNGLITKAANAKELNQKSEEVEKLKLVVLAAKTDNNGVLTEENLRREIKKEFDTSENYLKATVDGWKLTLDQDNIYIIENSGNIEKYGDMELLKAGDYVSYTYYDTKTNENKTEMFIVLYDKTYNDENNKNYGTQIISVNSLENVNLGSGDPYVTDRPLNEFNFPEDIYYWTKYNFQRAVRSYNSALETLNNVAQNYLNTDIGYSSRCVGSKPLDNKDKFSENTNLFNDTLNFEPYISILNVFKMSDDNYIEDKTQLDKLGITKAPNTNYYWVASRFINKNNTNIVIGIGGFYYHHITAGSASFATVSDSGVNGQDQSLYGFRPVITLKSSTKIDDGKGSQEEPYILSK